MRDLRSDEQTLEAFVVGAARVTGALSRERTTLTALVDGAARVSRSVAAERDRLRTSLTRLPGTLRRARTTFPRLRATLTDLDRLTDVALPATRELPTLFAGLRPLLRSARPAIADLRLLFDRPGPSNDLVALLRRAPRLARAARPALRSSSAALAQVTPVLDFARPYTPDLVGWLRDFGQSTANYDANGHFARVSPVFNAFSAASGSLEAISPDRRYEGLQTGAVRRCPGAATQPAADGSSPFTDDGLDCDSRLVVPGP